MKIIETEVYQFDELSDESKKVAIAANIEINVCEDWWEYQYEDAENAGLKITGFDIDRGSYCEGVFINSAKSCANYIVANHGDVCETYKTAQAFLAAWDNVQNAEEDGPIEDEENEFLNSLLGDYLTLLRKEYEYQTSYEAISEMLNINEYDFTIDGKRF